MNIIFKVEAISFADAADIEAILIKNNIKYTVILNPLKAKAKTRRTGYDVGRRTPLTKIEIAAVVLAIKSNPKLNNNRISKICGVSPASVARIKKGSYRPAAKNAE